MTLNLVATTTMTKNVLFLFFILESWTWEKEKKRKHSKIMLSIFKYSPYAYSCLLKNECFSNQWLKWWWLICESKLKNIYIYPTKKFCLLCWFVCWFVCLLICLCFYNWNWNEIQISRKCFWHCGNITTTKKEKYK